MVNRDGHTKSLWQATAEPFVSKSNVSAGEFFDVVIVGGGITGMSTAYLLQKAGKKCLLVEAQNLCFGTTGGTTAHINTVFDTPYSMIQNDFNQERAQKIADAAKAALNQIKRNISDLNIDCGFEEVSAIIYAEDESQEKIFEDILKSCKDVGVTVAEVNHVPASFKYKRAMRVEGQAKFHPVKYVYGLASAFEDAGGKILQECRVKDLKKDETLSVETTKGTFQSTDIVYATHIPPGINLLHLRCAPYRSYVVAVTLQDNNYPQELYYDLEEPYNYYRTQLIDGINYLIAGGKDHKTGDQLNTDQRYEELEAKIRQNFSIKEIAFKWSSQFFEPADGIAYIGPLPGQADHVYVATGFGGNGMTYGTISALILKSYILDEETPIIDKEIFNPSRVKPIAGFTEFVTHNLDVVKNFLGKLIPPEKLSGLADLAKGEGRIVEYENEKIGIYKTDEGKLHAVNPACAHMKCTVNWNSSERTWDCPCHGARYDYKGNVITAPADSSLESVDIDELNQK